MSTISDGLPALSAVEGSAEAASTASVLRRRDRVFYSGMAIAAAVAVYIGFYPTYYLRSQFQTTALPFYLHVHGAVFTVWILLFIAQTTLVAAHRVDLHRVLGWVVVAWAALMVVVGSAAGILSMRRNFAAGLEPKRWGF